MCLSRHVLQPVVVRNPLERDLRGFLPSLLFASCDAPVELPEFPVVGGDGSIVSMDGRASSRAHEPQKFQRRADIVKTGPHRQLRTPPLASDAKPGVLRH